eukprot:GHVU01026268.1.p1 GENE.GHVU01026268.1~~GHVU01026268.1.p1  ORF type:complete len:229 (+),score=34.11 GHVU01026268.1:75-761(+)
MSSVAQQNIPDIEYVKEIAFYAGEMIAKNIENRGKSVNTKKGKSDLVTETDVAVEAYLKKKISTKYPDHGFLCEESAAKGQRLGTGPTWIIDPIDGTTNFFHGYPYCGVSIAFASGGEVLVGCVHCPQMNQTFWGCKGRGSYLNGERLATSGVTDIGDSLVSTGFSVVNLQRLNDPNTSEAMKPQLQKYKEVVMYNAEQLVMRCQDIRRFGAIAVDLCQIGESVRGGE